MQWRQGRPHKMQYIVAATKNKSISKQAKEMEITHIGCSIMHSSLKMKTCFVQRVGSVGDLIQVETVPAGELVDMLIVFAVGLGGE